MTASVVIPAEPELIVCCARMKVYDRRKMLRTTSGSAFG